MKHTDLSIIIVSYNTAQLTIECIESILKTVKRVSYEIVVVDNASTDGSVEKIKRSFDFEQDKIFLIENNGNFGFSKANNIGVRESSGRYVLFLNSDTVVYENTIDGMVEFMDKNLDCGAATCYVAMPNGEMDDASHRGFPTPWRALGYFSGLARQFPKSKLFSGYLLGWMDLSTIHEIDALAGAFMIVRRTAGEKVGWWDEDFFWYGDDLDFCYRLKKQGWKIYFVPEFKILHYKGVSGGIKKISRHISPATRETIIRSQKARFDAMKLFYTKHYKNKYPSFINYFIFIAIETKRFLAKQYLKI